jgi:serine/threonine protein kinase
LNYKSRGLIMNKMNRITAEALSILKCILEDQLEDRYAYRNEVKRLTLGGLTLSFASLEHFLDRYGYLSIEQRSDSLNLTSSGIEAARYQESRLQSLNDDVLFHFSKELQAGVAHDAPIHVSTGKRFDQHYIRFEGIGRGGLGSVWRAEHLKSGRPVAIKTLEGIDEMITSGRKSTLKKRLERVVRQVAILSHPFICPILDLSVHHTPPYYVMPLYSGGSLRDLLRLGPMPPEVALNLFNQICLGLQHAHQRGVLHLDLKPENILLDDQGNIRIFDFGMSRTLAKQVAQLGRQAYIGFGSVAYMAPELLRDAQLESVSLDIYGLGLILYEILIGELPGRRSPMPSEVIDGLPEPIDELFDLMTQDRASKRPQSMDEVLSILNQVSPFDRVSGQSMVMTFHNPPLALPGLQNHNLPELEEAVDIQRVVKKERRRERAEAVDNSSKPQSLDSDEQSTDTESTTQQKHAQSSPKSAAPQPIASNVEVHAQIQALEEPAQSSRLTQRDQSLRDQSLTDQTSQTQARARVTSSVKVADHEPDHPSDDANLSSSQLDSDTSKTTPTSGVSPLIDSSASVLKPSQRSSDEFISSASLPTLTHSSAATSDQSESMKYRLNQSTEVIQRAPSSSQAVDDPLIGVDAALLNAHHSEFADISEMEELRDEVLEELEELEESNEESSYEGVLSSATPQGYTRSELASYQHDSGYTDAHQESNSYPASDFEDEEKTELKPLETSENLHSWPPSSATPQPRRVSVAQQLLERQKRGHSN